jgi:ATP-dependent exoDNAse (exonuclease V) alpha subunit
MVKEGVRGLDWKTEYALLKSRKLQHLVPYEMTYGYAITVHKNQGSQWDKVLISEESFPFSKDEHARHLYTAITRAVEKVVILKK